MKSYRHFILFLICAAYLGGLFAQEDKKALSTGNLFSQKKDPVAKKDSAKDIVAGKKDTVPFHNPRIATRRSALIPGWGQAYNKEYWKIPVVYGIIAIPTVLYFYNDSYYKKTKFAYEAVFAASKAIPDSSLLPLIDASVKRSDGSPLGLSTYQSYRNSFRQSRDYSILWFLLAWGLQVADATVFAHLKQFDVSSDLSMELNPVFNPVTKMPGLGLALSLKSPSRKVFAVTR